MFPKIKKITWQPQASNLLKPPLSLFLFSFSQFTLFLSFLPLFFSDRLSCGVHVCVSSCKTPEVRDTQHSLLSLALAPDLFFFFVVAACFVCRVKVN